MSRANLRIRNVELGREICEEIEMSLGVISTFRATLIFTRNEEALIAILDNLQLDHST